MWCPVIAVNSTPPHRPRPPLRQTAKVWKIPIVSFEGRPESAGENSGPYGDKAHRTVAAARPGGTSPDDNVNFRRAVSMLRNARFNAGAVTHPCVAAKCLSGGFMRLSKAMGKVAGQERRAARIGNTGKRLDEPDAFPMASLRVGFWRPSGSLRRSTDVPVSLFAARAGSPKANDKLQKSPGQTLRA